MIYVALLRGINVGGNNKIPMRELKKTFEKRELKSVTTYINSGNVVFEDKVREKKELESLLNQAIIDDFQLDIPIMIRGMNEYENLIKRLPEYWRNDGLMKSDVLFLSEEIDKKDTLKVLTIKEEIDTVIYTPGAILWTVDRKNVTKSGMMKIIGTELYKRMTVRNVNTTRKLYEIMKRLETKA